MKRFTILIAILAGAACTPPRSIEIPFEVHIGGKPVTCESAGTPLRMTDARFYVHDVKLIERDGRAIPVRLAADGIWQGAAVALVDLENGRDACQNGSPEFNMIVRGTTDAVDPAGLVFTIGVPADLNHEDPMLAGAPLGYTEMHWHWASGYKFSRFAVETDEDSFFIHLGSSRCEGTIGNIKGCDSANRPVVNLDGFRPGKDRVVLNLDRLVVGTDLADGIGTSCMSGPAEDSCVAPFTALGLDFQEGEPSQPNLVFTIGGGE